MGTLTELTIQPRTRARYDKAKKRFYSFLSKNSLGLPRERHLLDGILCDYLEDLWATGEGRGLASDTLAALQDTSPRLRGSIPGAWGLFKTWHVNETPTSLTPAPHTWRKLFSQALQALGLDSWEFRPYSPRRGGATFWFGQHGSLDRILLQGQWMAAKTARVYLNEGLAVLTEMKIPPAKLRPFRTVYVNPQRSPLPAWRNA